MPQIQVPPTTSPGTGSIWDIPREPVFVHIRAAWDDEWHEVDYLQPLEVVRAAAPTLSQATFQWRVGSVLQHDGSTFNVESRQDLLNCFVRISVAAKYDPDLRPLWYGIITDEDYRIGGSHAGGGSHAAGTPTLTDGQAWQRLRAYGLELLLHRATIEHGWVQEDDNAFDDFGDTTEIGWCPTFNRKAPSGWGLMGNRTTTTTADGGWPNGVHAFSQISGATWTPDDIIRYLLMHYGPTTAACSGMTWSLDTTNVSLDNATGVYKLDGLNVAQALNTLIDRRRGLGWCLDVDDDDVRVRVFSMFAHDITVGGTTLTGNGSSWAIVMDSTPNMSCEIIGRRTPRASYLTVYGSRVKSTFTEYHAAEGGAFENGWSNTEETDYLQTISDDAQETSIHRARPEFERVFCYFRIKDDWDWEPLDGGTAAPTVNADGTLGTGVTANVWIGGKRFLRHLPFLDTTGTNQARFETLMAFAPHPQDADKYVRLDKPPERTVGDTYPTIPILPAAGELGVLLRANPNYLLAGGGNVESKRTTQAAPYRVNDLVFTVCTETDERMRIEVDLGANYGSGPPNHIVIYVPEAELWYVNQGTIDGIAEDGSLHTYTGSQTPRDDTDMLERVAAYASAYYGCDRNAVRIGLAGIEAGFDVGQLLEAAYHDDPTGGAPIDTVVTVVIWSLSDNPPTTQIQTDHVAFDPRAGL